MDDPVAYLERGRLKIKMGELESGEADLAAARSFGKSEQQAIIRKTQGDIYQKLRDTDKANQMYDEAEQLGYEHYDIYMDRARVKLIEKDYPAAKDYLSKAINRNPYDPDLYVLRGEIQAELGMKEEAAADFDQSRAMGASELTTMKVMARSNIKMAEFEEAIHVLEEAIKIDPEDADILLLRGQAFNEIQAYNIAKESLDNLIIQDPFLAEAYYERGKTHIALSFFEKALLDLTKAIRLRPDYVGAMLDRGVAYGLTGNYNEALEDFKNVLALDPKNKEALYNKGLALYQMRSYIEACATWQKTADMEHEGSSKNLKKLCSKKELADKGVDYDEYEQYLIEENEIDMEAVEEMRSDSTKTEQKPPKAKHKKEKMF